MVQRFDLDLFDEEGVCITLKGFSLREVPEIRQILSNRYVIEKSKPGFDVDTGRYSDSNELITLKPIWEPLSSIEKDFSYNPGRVLMIGSHDNLKISLKRKYPGAEIIPVNPGDDASTLENSLKKVQFVPENDHLLWVVPSSGTVSAFDENLIQGQETGVMGLFSLIKALLKSGHARQSVKLSIVVQGAQKLFGEEGHDPSSASVLGLVGAMAPETTAMTQSASLISPEVQQRL